MAKIACPKCNSKKVYKLQSGKRRCAQCRYEFIPHKLPLTFSRDEWKKIIHLFLMEQSSNSINEQTGFEQRQVLRALTKIRFVMMKDVPEIFSGTVEVDETYLGGQWKNKRKTIRDKETKRGRGTEKQPVFGILCRNGTVWAEVVDDVGADTLKPLISQKVSTGTIVCSDTWKAYTGIAACGDLARTRRSKEGTWTKKNSKSYFGFKVHSKEDCDYGLIWEIQTSKASLHDSQIDLSKEGEVVYRDKG